MWPSNEGVVLVELKRTEALCIGRAEFRHGMTRKTIEQTAVQLNGPGKITPANRLAC